MLYDNETGRWVFEYEYIDHPECDWWQDAQGYLYILPPWESPGEIDGPDDTGYIWSLAYFCRHAGRNPTEDDMKGWLDLTYIPHNLRRFNEVDGYYHA